jgi:class I fructose-bisphosphate aldolase
MKENRLRRIFDTDQRTVIVACDHAGFSGPLPGLEDPGKLIDTLASTGVDAVLTTMGIARRYACQMGRLGLILRMDGGSSIRAPQMSSLRNNFSMEDAVRLGADAVICMGMIGYPEEAASLANLAELTAQSAVWNIPVVAEMLVKPKDGQSPASQDIGFAMRIGVELGADMIKASYAGPPEQFRAALQTCYRPVVVLGGEKSNQEACLLESIAAALDCGATGVAIGRNVWQHPNPAGICRSLIALVHQGASVDTALKELAA